MTLLPHPRKLSPSGFTHLLIPILVVIVIALLGGLVYDSISKAATIANSVSFTSGVGSSKCMDDAYDSKANYTKVQLYSCNKNASQQWIVNTNGTIENANGSCLDLSGAKYTNNTKIVMYSCNTNAAQQWKLSNNTIVNPKSGKCLDDPYSTATNGTQLIIYTCKGTTNQKWTPSTTVSQPGGSGSGTTGSGTTGSGTTGSGGNQTASSTCAPSYQTITVNGEQWNRTSNNWGGANACLNTWDGKTVSYLIQSQSATPSGGVMGYPDVSQGCDSGGGGCTTGWTSKQVSALTNPEVTWTTSHANAVSGSKFDTGADLWLSSTPTFKTKGAEIFIALNNQGEPPSTSKQVTISGVSYYFYVVPQSSWNEIIFARVNEVSSVTNMAILPFFQYCVTQNLFTSSDYWVNASFGNEIWQLGTGLETTGISLTE
jgi:hypothetical protein